MYEDVFLEMMIYLYLFDRMFFQRNKDIQVGEGIGKLVAVGFNEPQRSKAVVLVACFLKKFRSLQVWSKCEIIASYKSWLEKLVNPGGFPSQTFSIRSTLNQAV